MASILPLSGGKNSTALLIRLHELKKMPDRVVFCDTGLEYPDVYKYIQEIQNYISKKIEIVKGKKSWEDQFYKVHKKGKLEGEIWGFPHVTVPCWAQRDLKVRVMQKLQDPGDLVLLGIAADESHRKQTYDKVYRYKYPLIEWGWTDEKCREYLKDKGLTNPVYEKFTRTGCWLCPKQKKENLITLMKLYPELWKLLKKYERDSPHGFSHHFKLEDIEKE